MPMLHNEQTKSSVYQKTRELFSVDYKTIRRRVSAFPSASDAALDFTPFPETLVIFICEQYSLPIAYFLLTF